ncbi:hypothetical protein CC1G_00446 [Coprinopsis cinerea okayama7|uniref:DNA replication factor Cdt1 C-terminal domain-containing protein n=1 Tax=Coprinopsis cinerea (strain Okayama-7 / 130 / ATCC MYA-4618 / FGSC 9003) TaxID=240176 RepID=A8NXZ2_COPC7|nr:hypothetical protein CC1G_00446 [Coprinopsis cinerea okayama7\|eukprot:XP_001837310.1 hypothetical protein CC1G_00446 [Coprinopsis cinerea okayama7\
MSSLYTSLNVSPKKKRALSSDDESTTTPKKLRTAPLTPKSITRSKTQKCKPELPTHLSRLLRIQNAVQQALAHALATCAISPSSDSGRVLNVLNHISLKTYAGLTTSFQLDDLKRLCWLWEWDGEPLNKSDQLPVAKPEEDNPFLEAPPPSVDWTRGSQGFVLSLGSHYSKVDRKRIPAYGLGIEVEIDLDKDMGGGMAAVARWTAAGETRRAEFLKKLERWVEIHSEDASTPPIPLADLPALPATTKPSALTRTLASQSPKSGAAAQKFPIIPSSPSRSPTKKPTKDFANAVPFPMLTSRSSSPTKVGRLLFPQTPSRRLHLASSTDNPNPQTPSSSVASPAPSSSVPSTPVHRSEGESTSIPQTPTSSRRQALYERVRLRSLSKSPTKTPTLDRYEGSGTPNAMMKLTQEALRRRCILARLTEVAESVWMFFSSSAPSGSMTPSSRKRRMMPMSEVAAAIIKSSAVPISVAEANESLNMLVQLCPFFLKKVVITGKDWLEMPSTSSNGSTRTIGLGSPSKRDAIHASPSKRSTMDSAQELLTRSPRSVKREAGGLREVREIIRKELELDE